MVSAATATPAAPTPTQDASAGNVADELATNAGQQQSETPGQQGEDAGEQQEQREPIVLPDGWEGSDAVKPVLQKHRDEGYRDAQSKLTITHTRTLKEQEARLEAEKQSAVNEAVSSGVVQQVQDQIIKIADGFAGDQERDTWLHRLLSQHKEYALAFSESQKETGGKDGFKKGIFRASELLYPALNKELGTQMEDFIITEINVPLTKGAITHEEAFTQALGKFIDLVRADERTKVEALVSERQAAETTAAERSKAPVPAKTDGRGSAGKRSYTQADLRKMSVTDILNADQEAVDAALASGR
jgi:hypothetical protein